MAGLLLLAHPSPAAPPPDASLAALTVPVRTRALVGAKVVSLTKGDTLWELNPGLCLVPASNQKLLTAAAALERLGPDFRFRTEVLALGTQRTDGTLDGDLILRGGGDALLTASELESLAAAVDATGIRRVRGRLRADDTRYAREPLGEGWSWDDEPYAYAAQVSALSLDGNVVTVEVSPGERPGMPARVVVTPAAGYVTLRSRCRTSPAELDAMITVSRERGRNAVLVTGEIPVGSEPVRRRVTVETPALYAAAVFRRLLARRGIRVEGEAALLGTPQAARLVAYRDSPPLAEILARMNKASDNLVAETLLRELGRTTTRPGSSAAGLAVVAEVARDLGLDPVALRVADGSGLSRLNLVSAENLCRLLVAMARHRHGDVFAASLPVAGVDGTLRGRMVDTAAAGNARAKTGTLSHVSALSGYVTTANGERLAFALVTNNDPGPAMRPDGPKRTEDAVVAQLAALARAGGPPREGNRNPGGRL